MTDQAPESALRKSLKLEWDGPIALLTLNEPDRLNALTLPLADALHDVLHALSRNGELRALVIRGEGRAFMAGGDLVYLRDAAPDAAASEAGVLIDRLHAVLTLLTDLPIPVIASVHGAVAGAGNSLMLACDYAIAAEDTRFIYAYGQIGASPDGGLSWSLPRMIGIRKAMAFAFLDQQIGTGEALQLGLLNIVVASADLARETLDLARKLAALPTLAFGKTKRLMRRSFEHGLPDQLMAERDAFCASTATEDFREGVAAFFERRTAQFGGR